MSPTLRVKMLRHAVGQFGVYEKGDEYNMPVAQARELIAGGHAEQVSVDTNPRRKLKEHDP